MFFYTHKFINVIFCSVKRKELHRMSSIFSLRIDIDCHLSHFKQEILMHFNFKHIYIIRNVISCLWHWKTKQWTIISWKKVWFFSFLPQCHHISIKLNCIEAKMNRFLKCLIYCLASYEAWLSHIPDVCYFSKECKSTPVYECKLTLYTE